LTWIDNYIYSAQKYFNFFYISFQFYDSVDIHNIFFDLYMFLRIRRVI